MQFIFNNPLIKDRRRCLRNNLTETEVIIWAHIKNKKLGYKFRRQSSIDRYIVDFYCPKKKLVLEIDGGQHLEDKSILHDNKRTEYLNSLGIKVLRIYNNDVFDNIEGVIDKIKYELENTPQSR